MPQPAILTSPQPAKQAAAKAYNLFNLISWVVGAKSVNTINVGLQLQDARGQNLASLAHVELYLSSAADGHTISGTATTSAIAVGTNGVLLATPVSGPVVECITGLTGLLDLNLIQTASPVTYYLCARMPDGSIAVSPAITF